MDNYKEEGICSICFKKYTHWGNNAYPVNEGRCCDECNANIVIPARIQQMINKENKEVNNMENIIKMKDCTDNVKIITALEDGTLELNSIEDWNRLKEIVKELSSSQGFYERLLRNMEKVNEEELEFPILFGDNDDTTFEISLLDGDNDIFGICGKFHK